MVTHESGDTPIGICVAGIGCMPVEQSAAGRFISMCTHIRSLFSMTALLSHARSGSVRGGVHARPRPTHRAAFFFASAVLALGLLAFGGIVPAASAATPQVSPAMLPAESADAKTLPLTPHMEVLLDPAQHFTIEDVAGVSGDAPVFTPLAQGLPREYSGALWLRLNMLPNTGARSGKSIEYRLKLGHELAGETVLFVPESASAGTAGKPAFVSDTLRSGDVLFTVPGSDPGPLTLYLKLSGLPGLWFSPGVEPVAKAVPALPMDLALAALLAAGLLMGLLRFALDKAAWRGWGVLLTGLALYVGFFPSLMPAAFPADHAAAAKLAASLMAPGLMLMLLSHCCRYLLRIPATTPGADILFRLYPLLGAALALLPLAPGLGWTARYLPFWPALLLPLLFVALHCLARQVPGSLAALALTALPMLGAGGACFELFNSPLPLLGSQGYIWGIGLAVLVLGITPDTRPSASEETETNLLERYAEEAAALDRSLEESGAQAGIFAAEQSETQTAEAATAGAEKNIAGPEPAFEPSVAVQEQTDGSPLDASVPTAVTDSGAAHTDDTPSLLLEVDEERASILAAQAALGVLDAPRVEDPADPAGQHAPAMPDAPGADDSSRARSPEHEDTPDATRESLETPASLPEAPAMPEPETAPVADAGMSEPVLPEATVPEPVTPVTPEIGATPLPESDPATEALAPADLPETGAENPDSAPETCAPEMAPPTLALLDDTPEPAPLSTDAPLTDARDFGPVPTEKEHARVVFDLPTLVREVYESATDEAEEKGLAVSWFISPYLGNMYEGDAAGLESVLRLLLADVTTKLDKGSLSLSVRRSPGDSAPGHLLFALEIWSPAHPDGFTDATLPLSPGSITKAWAFSGQSKGLFSLEHAATGSVNLAFSVQFASVSESAAAVQAQPAYPVAAPAPALDARDAVNTEESVAPQLARPSTAPSVLSGASLALEDAAERTVEDADSGLRIITTMQAVAESLADDSVDQQPFPEDTWDSGRIIVTDMAAGGRRNYVSQLQPLGREVLEAREGHECVRVYAKHPSGLALFDADMPESDIAAAIAAIRRLEDERELPRTAMLAITSHDLQSDRMLSAGCTECLVKPVAPQDLRDAVERLAPYAVPVAAQEDETADARSATESSPSAEPLPAEDRTVDTAAEIPAAEPAVPAELSAEAQLAAAVEDTPADDATAEGAGDADPAPAAPRPESLDAALIDALDMPPVAASAPSTEAAAPETTGVSEPSESSEPSETSEAADPVAAAKPPVQKRAAPVVSVSVGGAGVRRNRKAALVAKPRDITPVRQEKTPQEKATGLAGDKTPVKMPEKTASEDFSLVGLKAEDIVPEIAVAAPSSPSPSAPAAELEKTAPAVDPAPAAVVIAPANDAPAAPRDGSASENEEAERSGSSRELPLLDLIITDDDGAEENDAAQSVVTVTDSLAAENMAATGEGDRAAPANPSGIAPVQEPVTEPVAGCIPLPGENDSVSAEMLPFIPGLLYEMDDALKDARQGIHDKSSLLVQEASKRLGDKAAAFDLHVLERVARCVERAATADDLEAVGDLFAELEQLTLRYKEALRRCHQDAAW